MIATLFEASGSFTCPDTHTILIEAVGGGGPYSNPADTTTTGGCGAYGLTQIGVANGQVVSFVVGGVDQPGGYTLINDMVCYNANGVIGGNIAGSYILGFRGKSHTFAASLTSRRLHGFAHGSPGWGGAVLVWFPVASVNELSSSGFGSLILANPKPPGLPPNFPWPPPIYIPGPLDPELSGPYDKDKS
jgi:hypothetical protein